MVDEAKPDIIALTVQLLSAFVANNSVPSEGLADLIKSTRAALTSDASAPDNSPEADAFVPAVSVRKSVSSTDHILSLIDGKPYKTLKRHLASHGLSPEEYRARYKLPQNYPMVAQSYSQARRAVAQKLGLGKSPAAAAAVAPVANASASLAPTKASRARSKSVAKAASAPWKAAAADVSAKDATMLAAKSAKANKDKRQRPSIAVGTQNAAVAMPGNGPKVASEIAKAGPKKAAASKASRKPKSSGKSTAGSNAVVTPDASGSAAEPAKTT